MGVEPTSLAWKASIIAVIRQSQLYIQHIVPLIRIELICQPINLSTPYENEGIQRYGQSRRLSRNLLLHRRYASVRVLKYTFIC